MTHDIPNFNETGTLPAGIHLCTGFQFIDRFCKGNPKREDLTKAVIDILDFAKSRNSRYIFVGGSFITNKEDPADLDVVVTFRNKDHIPSKSERLILAGKRVDIMFCSEDEPKILDSFIHLLSHGRFDDDRGIIQMEVESKTQPWKINHLPDEDTYEVIKRAYFNRELVDLNESAGVLVTVHGLLSDASWNSHIVPIASSQGWTVAPYYYGYQTPDILFSENKRKSAVDAFRDWIFEINQTFGRNTNISIIAHSFGTYLVGKYLDGFKDMPPVTFNSIILTGSILNESFDWTACAGKKVARVRNEIAPNDQWVKWMPEKKWLGLDPLFGQAGIQGFKDKSQILTQHENSIFDHNNVIKRDVITSHWLPYLNSNRNVVIQEFLKVLRKKDTTSN